MSNDVFAFLSMVQWVRSIMRFGFARGRRQCYMFDGYIVCVIVQGIIASSPSKCESPISFLIHQPVRRPLSHPSKHKQNPTHNTMIYRVQVLMQL